MDSGTDAAALLEGRGLGTRPGKAGLGYVGVVNRSQQATMEGKQLVDARQHEQDFFRGHAAYAHPAACHTLCGTAQLVKRCSAILQQHIRTVLPGLTVDLGRMLAAKRARLAQLQAEMDPDMRDNMRMGALVAYADAADALVRGLTHTHTRDAHTLALLSSGELVGGARVEALLSTAFAEEVEACNVFELISANEIIKLAKNMSGLGGGLLLTPNRAFDAVVVSYVRSLEEVCLRCVARVRTELSQLLREVRLESLDTLPSLEAAIKLEAERVLAAEVDETEVLVRTLLAMEACRVNLHHGDFAGNPSRLPHAMEEVRSELAAYQSNPSSTLGAVNPLQPFQPLAHAAEPQHSQHRGQHRSSIMEGSVCRRAEARASSFSSSGPSGLVEGLLGSPLEVHRYPCDSAWQERYLVLGNDRVLRVYKQRADVLLDKHEVVGLEQLPESVMLHGARAALEAEQPVGAKASLGAAETVAARPHSVRLSSSGKQRELLFACSSSQEAAGWARALCQAAEELRCAPPFAEAGARLSAVELSSRRGSDILPRAPGRAAAAFTSSSAAAGSAAAAAAGATDGLPLPPPPPADAACTPAMPWPAQVAHLELSSGELYEWGLMHKLLLSYTRLVQKNIVDLVPKAITHRLVDTTLHKLRLELLRALGSGSPSTDCLMAVSEQAEREYRETEQLVQTLSEYEAILRQVAGSGHRPASVGGR